MKNPKELTDAIFEAGVILDEAEAAGIAIRGVDLLRDILANLQVDELITQKARNGEEFSTFSSGGKPSDRVEEFVSERRYAKTAAGFYRKSFQLALKLSFPWEGVQFAIQDVGALRSQLEEENAIADRIKEAKKTFDERCDACDGVGYGATGNEWDLTYREFECGVCGGSGEMSFYLSGLYDRLKNGDIICPTCNGDGVCIDSDPNPETAIPEMPCWRCPGDGFITLESLNDEKTTQ